MSTQEPTTLARQSEGVIDLLERVVVKGDLSQLSSAERLTYYKAVCESVGLNPLTKPLDYLTLNGKLVLYANRSCTDQLRTLHGVSITKLERDKHTDVYIVTAYATDGKGRTDAATGAVFTGQLKGDMLANALMKAETKAKRRVTLSLCGLGLLDETEVETIPGAIPQTIVSDPSRPMTEDEAKAEAAVLFPSPEDDERRALLDKINAIRPPSRLKVLKQRILGDAEADLSKRDVAELKLLADQASL